MSRKATVAAGLLALAVSVGAPRASDAQVPQQDRMRQHLQQMDQQIQRMDRIRDRIHQLDQQLLKQMDRIREQDRLRDEQYLRDQQRIKDQERLRELDRVREQQHLRDQERLRQHQQVQELCWAMADMAQQMQRNAQRARQMAGEPAFVQDPQLLQEMERLRERWRIMGDELEQGLQSLERMQRRLGEGLVAAR